MAIFGKGAVVLAFLLTTFACSSTINHPLNPPSDSTSQPSKSAVSVLPLRLGGEYEHCKVDWPEEWDQALRKNQVNTKDNPSWHGAVKGKGSIYQPADRSTIFWKNLGGETHDLAALSAGQSLAAYGSDGKHLALLRNEVQSSQQWFGGMELLLWRIGAEGQAASVWKSPTDQSGRRLSSPHTEPVVAAGKVFWIGIEAQNPEQAILYAANVEDLEPKIIKKDIGADMLLLGDILVLRKKSDAGEILFAIDTKTLVDVKAPTFLGGGDANKPFISDGSTWAFIQGSELKIGDAKGEQIAFKVPGDSGSYDNPYISDGYVSVWSQGISKFYIIDTKMKSYANVPHPIRALGGAASTEIGRNPIFQTVVSLNDLPRFKACEG